MELRYPLLLIIVPICFFLFFMLVRGKKETRKNGRSVANTSFIKNTDFFKEKMKKYNVVKKVLYCSLGVAVVAATLLISRISLVQTKNTNEYNRDIFLCMDVSSSVDELNMELVENLKDTVKSLKGERFGISIFNSSSVVLVPLTDDYEYVLNVLDKIYESIAAYEDFDYGFDYDDENYFSVRNYIIGGTQEGAEERGSSLIGDGLASCIYSFSNLEEERTRIVILSTDNDLAGTPIATLSQAADIAKKKNIKVFGIGTTVMRDDDRLEFNKAVSKTGGKFYEQNKATVRSIVNDIEKTSKSMLKKELETTQTDIPEIPFTILLIAVFALMFFSKKVIR